MITMRQLLPTRLYPGRSRVGKQLTSVRSLSRVKVFDGVDWYWLPSMFGAAAFVIQQRPDFLVLQWWSGTVLHSYIALAILSRVCGARIVVEFHEILETGEVRVPLAARYIRALAPVLMRLSDAFVVHSRYDQEQMIDTFKPPRDKPTVIVPLAPFDHFGSGRARLEPLREPPSHVVNVLFFGVIRPYKGLEYLVRAFDAIPDELAEQFWLTVVGETWEGWTLPTELIERSSRRDRITFVNRYVTDEELHRWLLGADAVALPYLRSSISGPLHVAVGYGIPIVITEVGGNVEAAARYEGIEFVPPAQVAPLADALVRLSAGRNRRRDHAHSWSETSDAYEELFQQLERKGSPS
jgi:glycosyltransferase involved in cell wall biosynthesis